MLPKKSVGKHRVIVAFAATIVIVAVVLLVRREAERPAAPSASTPPSRIEPSPAKDHPPTRSSPTTPDPSRNDNQAVVRGLRIAGVFGGARPRVSVKGDLLGVGDIVDASRGILVHSINADTRTITFIDGSGEIYSRTLD